MSSVDRYKAMMRELERMPQMGESARLSQEALRVLVDGGTVSVSHLKVQLEDIEGDRVTLAFAFCDENDVPIVNMGRVTMLGAGSTLTLARIANCLSFNVN